MQVVERELWHLHRTNEYDNLWIPNYEIDNTQNFINERTRKIETSDLYRSVDKYTEYARKIAMIKHALDLRKLSSLKGEFHLLQDTLDVMRTMQIENELEKVRLLFFPEKVCRRNAIWLCDKKQLSFWTMGMRPLGGLSLIRVSVTGNLTRADGSYLRMDYTEEDLFSYWKTEETKEESISDEYLFQGRLKVLSKQPLEK